MSISQAWDETRALLQSDGKLFATVALALMVLPGLVASLFTPTPKPGQLPEPGMWIAVFLVAVLIAIYMVTTIAAAVRTEEAFLRRAFGDTYDRYVESRAEPMPRPFSLARALRNREYRAVSGIAAGFAILALKVLVSL